MPTTAEATAGRAPAAAFTALDAHVFRASQLTRGPWHPQQQHAGPPIALVSYALEAAAQAHGLLHMARLTANLLRPVPIADIEVRVQEDYVGRIAAGRMFAGPSAVWFRLSYPLVQGQKPSPYQRVAVAADSGNGISAILDLSTHVFVNSDLSINLLRRPVGEWICLDARTHLSSHGGGLAESALYDETGLIGRATQSLFVRKRD